MAFAEHEVFVQHDASTVYSFLLNGLNLPCWQPNIRSSSLSSEIQVRVVARAVPAARLPAVLEEHPTAG